MRLRFSQQARRDLKAIYRKSAEQFGLVQADHYQDGLLASLSFCAESPQAVPERDDLSIPVRTHRYQSHLIVFRIVQDEVLIVRVLHGRQDVRII